MNERLKLLIETKISQNSSFQKRHLYHSIKTVKLLNESSSITLNSKVYNYYQFKTNYIDDHDNKPKSVLETDLLE